MRFDWYAATLSPGKVDRIAKGIGRCFSHWAVWEQSKPHNGYDYGLRLVHGPFHLATMLYGGFNGTEHGPHVYASGEGAQVLAEGLRRVFPVHRVSRVDACEDYRGEGVFAAITGIALRVADERGVLADWRRPVEGQEARGATLYVGSPKSDVMVRLYEKGKQLLQSGEDPQADPTHARAEIQVRPHGKLKEFVAQMSPSEVWGLSGHSCELARRLGNTELQRVPMRAWRKSDEARALRAMLKQYGGVLRSLCLQESGDWGAVGLRIARELEAVAIETSRDQGTRASGVRAA